MHTTPLLLKSNWSLPLWPTHTHTHFIRLAELRSLRNEFYGMTLFAKATRDRGAFLVYARQQGWQLHSKNLDKPLVAQQIFLKISRFFFSSQALKAWAKSSQPYYVQPLHVAKCARTFSYLQFQRLLWEKRKNHKCICSACWEDNL